MNKRVKYSIMGKKRSSKGDNIVILRFSALGDVAMTIPVVYSVAKSCPELNFIYITKPSFAGLFINKPLNLNVELVDFSALSGIKAWVRVIRKISKMRPAAIVDLHNVSRTWIIDTFFRLRGKKVVMVDKGRARRRYCLKHKIPQKSFIERYLETFNRLGLKHENDFISLFPESGGTVPIEIKHPALGIAPFARYFNKRYPLELMQRLIEILVSAGINVYLFGGGKEEIAIIGTWVGKENKCVSVAGKYSMSEELAIMSRLDAMLSMDSANQHLASLAGVRVFTIWGATTPLCGFSPWRQSPKDSFVSGADCQPCTIAGSETCRKGEVECLRSLTPEYIAQHIITQLT